VVIFSAFVPTLIAEKFFQPTILTMEAWDRLRNINKNKKNNKEMS
jgi:hypothetical protein